MSPFPRPIRASVTAVAALVLLLAAAATSAAAAKKPPPPPPPPSTTPTFMKNYADVVSGVEASATPEDVQPTADGGTLALSGVPSPAGVFVSWLTKLDSTGAIQWQEEVGCLSTPPGDYSQGASLQPTKDGAWIFAGSTIGCGSGAVCPATSGTTCGLIEKITATGAVVFARAYAIGARDTTFAGIQPTGSGGFVVAGSVTDASGTIGGLVTSLDGDGHVQWATTYAPPSSFQAADFASVAPTPDGGAVAVGRLTANGRFSLSVVELDASGHLLSQHAYNNVAGGSPISSVQPLSIIQTHDGGYAVAGTFNSTTGAGTCCSGPLLLKLDAQGGIQLQHAYEGGVYCFSSGLGEQCNSIGGIAYAVRQNKDGGFVLAGASNIEMRDGTPLEPWLARVDASGALIWQENDYRVNPQTGRPLSEYFAGVATTSTGFFALGATDNYSNGQGELLGVSTDGDGHVSLTCADEHSSALLAPADPGLVDLVPQGSTVAGTAASESAAPVQTLATGGTGSAPQC